MAQLQEVISSILHDFIKAQQEANSYSAQLESTIGGDDKAKNLRIPTVSIEEVELELKYSIKEFVTDSDSLEVDVVKLNQLSKELCLRLANSSIDSVVSAVMATDAVSEDADKLLSLLIKGGKQRHDFCSFLSSKMKEALGVEINGLIDDSGYLVQEAALSVVTAVIRSEFLLHPTFISLFTGKAGENLQKEVEVVLKQSLLRILVKHSKGICFTKNKKALLHADIVVSTDELQKIASEAVQTVKFKLHFHNKPQSQHKNDCDNSELITE